ncbi:hypothetical protein M9H77_04838 [Catharanthus roseus]|uniref:Uncharacterized protein n=1 Tax=Catharanthus roseus TaxID=4058 RepID=A0ACC0CFE1_CATRO|nr:hypothetical protein M9H77_04838 [Catharanthus roseus]
MRIPIPIPIPLLFIIVFIALDFSVESIHLTDEVEVQVTNNLGPNAPELVVRCQSKDDDLGKRPLPYQGNYSWKFHPIPFKTLYFCHFWWSGKEQAFEVYHITKLECVNRTFHTDVCRWEVRPDGFYFSTNVFATYDHDWGKKYDWK